MTDDAMITTVGISAAVLVLGGIVALAVRAQRQLVARLRALAARRGFDFVPGSRWWTNMPRVTGRVRGKRVEFYNYTTGSGKSRTTWSALAVAPNVATPLTFSLEKQGLLTKLSALFGVTEITVGDAAFDARWFIRTNRPEFLRAALLPEVRAKLDAAREAGATGEFKLDGGAVSYSERGTFSEERLARLESLLEVVGDLADIAEVAA